MERRVKHVLTGVATAATAIAALGLIAIAQESGSEPPPVVKASAVLTPAQLSGPHYKVEEAVETPGYFHEFTLTTDFGPMTAEGLSQLPVRAQEVAALAALQDVSRSRVFLESAGQSLVAVGGSIVNVVTAPVDTAKGIGSGVKRLGVNIGRRTKRAYESVTADDKKPADESTKDDKGAAGAAVGVAKNLLGVNGAMRRWARKVGADPYTTNPILRDALDRIAQVDVAGSLATKIVVPIPGILSTTATIGDLVWAKDPEELRKMNDSRARELGAPEDGAKAFYRNKAFTLTLQTRLIAALHAVNVPGCGDYIASAAEAAHEREAIYFTESAEMLQALHAKTKVAAILTDSKTIVSKLPSGQAVALLPVDWIRQTGTAEGLMREFADRAKAELGATSLAMKVTGTMSERAKQGLAGLGWRQY